jgi:hypothetical protein
MSPDDAIDGRSRCSVAPVIGGIGGIGDDVLFGLSVFLFCRSAPPRRWP